MKREIKVGSISYIDRHPNPVWLSAQAGILEPAWIPITYLGLAATANPAPPTTVADFKKYQDAQDFRAMTYCRFSIDINDATGQLNSFKVLDAFHDGGFTPFFRLRNWPMSGAKLKFDIWMSWKAWPGEASPLSLVNTQARHKSTTITGVPANETVLVNALVKFRAGSHTDATGVSTDVGCPFHVPWVWCETLLTFTKGNLKLYGRGSIFPTHIWYLDDAQKLKQPQVGDTSFPLTYTKKVSLWPLAPTSIAVPTMPTIVVRNLQIYPVLSAGAPAVPDSAQMPPLSDEAKQSGPVDTHAYTVSGDSILTSP